MTFFSDWFNQLDPTLRIFWGIAIFASIVVIIQMTMSFAGMGDIDSGDADVDFSTDTDSLDDAGSMHLLSIRNIFYFLLGFGWAGISLWNTIPDTIVLTAAAVLVGCLFVAVFIFLFRQMMKLQSNGAFNVNDAVGKLCDVYLRIPGQNQGQGKVQISFNGSVQELDARTQGQPLPSGTKVRVLRVIDKKVLEVEKA
ncbi:MAG: NfeD family protein [Bacteroidaceae bacterium]|nr:NfeD family protein [Bacteroidaceae bacterium]